MFKANKDYYLGAPDFDRLVFKKVQSSNLLSGLMSGDIDVLSGNSQIPLADWETAKNTQGIVTKSVPTFAYQYMAMNTARDYLTEDVRHAISLAINRQVIVDQLLQGEARIAIGPLAEDHPYFDEKLLPIEYDPEKAKSMLEAAGWDSNRELQVLVSTGNEVREKSAILIQQDLQKIGIKTKIQTLDFPTLLTNARNGDYDLCFIGSAGSVDPSESVPNVTAGYMNNFAQLSDPNVDHFAVSATRFMSGKFPLMIFGLPGAALAMYRTAKPEKRKAVGGLLLSAALTSMLTGITEPLEFSFLFVAPVLFAVQVVLAGSAYMIAHILNIAVGLTFSGGFLDLLLFGILQGNAKTSWIRIIPVGIIYFFLYYFIFSFLIKKLDLKTPGREDDDAETKLYTKADVNAKKAGNTEAGTEGTSEDSLSAEITRGLGGSANIEDVDCCATRLRCTVSNADLVNDGILKATGASGVVHRGQGVQIIYGPGVTVIKANLEDYLEHAPKELYEPQKDAESTGQNISEDDKIETKAEEKKIVDTIVISSPITGVAADLSTTPDEAFAGRMMGDGAVVTPEDAIVRAPEDGEVCFVFDTKHAIGFMTESGVSLLIHVGIDTVKLDGKGFECFVENGQTVKKGDPMLKLDLDYLKANAPSVASPVLCTELEDNQKIRLLNEGEIKAGDELFAIDIYEA